MMKIIIIMEFCGFHRESYGADFDAGDDIYVAGNNTYVDVDENDDD